MSCGHHCDHHSQEYDDESSIVWRERVYVALKNCNVFRLHRCYHSQKSYLLCRSSTDSTSSTEHITWSIISLIDEHYTPVNYNAARNVK